VGEEKGIRSKKGETGDEEGTDREEVKGQNRGVRDRSAVQWSWYLPPSSLSLGSE
jgi:hypothetical protein